jgi:hypothetical protein
VFVEETPALVKISGLAMTGISATLLVFYLGTKQHMPGIVQIFCATTAVSVFGLLGYFWTQGNKDKKELER